MNLATREKIAAKLGRSLTPEQREILEAVDNLTPKKASIAEKKKRWRENYENATGRKVKIK